MKKIYIAPEIEVISTFSNESVANAVVDGQATMVGHTSKGDITYDPGSDWTGGSDVVDTKSHHQWGDLWN